ncbi:unnamed protein product, partial [Prunus brigantina]
WKWRNRPIFSLLGNPIMIQLKLFSLLLDNGYRLPVQPQKNLRKSRFSLLGNLPVMVDGSRRSSSGCIGAGGVIRNLRGDWVSGFSVTALFFIYTGRRMKWQTLSLANWSNNTDLGQCILESAPSWVSSKLLDDLLGVVHSLLVGLNHPE